MTSLVVPFLHRRIAPIDWSQAELAEFYRVEAALIAAGMRVVTDRGLTDEGDPWFVFCHADDEQDVIIHFARIGGSYLVSAANLGGAEVGGDFRTLVRHLIHQYEEIAARRRDSTSATSGKVVLHPAAMLWVLVALAFLKSAEARAFEGNATPHAGAGYDPTLSPLRDDGGGINPLSAMTSYALQSMMVAWATATGTLIGEMHVGSADTFLSWLAVEHPTTPEAAVAFAAAHPSETLPDGGYSAFETNWTGHSGSSSVPGPGIAPAGTSGLLFLDHGSNHAALESTPAAGFHGAAEMALLGGGAELPITHPMAEAETVLMVAATNIALKNVEGLSTLSAKIATVLGHAIHLSGGDSIESAVVQAKEVLVVTSTTDETHAAVAAQSQASGAAPASSSGSATAASASSEAAAALGPGAVFSSHSTDSAPASGPAITSAPPSSAASQPAVGHPADPVHPTGAFTATPTPVAATAAPLVQTSPPPLSLDQAKLAVATSAVHEFLVETPQAKTILSSSMLIVYDPLAVDVDLAHVQALTFDFSDGSHISLVGLPSELTHALTGHP